MSGTPVPLKQKKSAKLEQVLKNITVGDVEEHADCPETIYIVLIDLVKFDVQKKVSYQLGNFSGSTFMVSDKKGNPIQDMPNTRGMTINCFQYCYFI